MKSYLIAIGSNLGDRQAFLRSGIQMLAEEVGPVVATSGFYRTAPVGAATDEFINAALICSSRLEPLEVMEVLLRIEARHGRCRKAQGGNRTLDCDLILCRTEADIMMVIHGKSLTLPHPRALERDFVLVPAAEIAPAWRHPGSGKTLREECLARKFHLDPMERS